MVVECCGNKSLDEKNHVCNFNSDAERDGKKWKIVDGENGTVTRRRMKKLCRPGVFQRRCYMVTSQLVYYTLSSSVSRVGSALRYDQSAVSAHLAFP